MDLLSVMKIILTAFVVKEVHSYEILRRVTTKDVWDLVHSIPPLLKKNLPWALEDYWQWLRCKFHWPWNHQRSRPNQSNLRRTKAKFIDSNDDESKINFVFERNGLIHTHNHESTTESEKNNKFIETKRRFDKDESFSDYVDYELYDSLNSLHKLKQNNYQKNTENKSTLNDYPGKLRSKFQHSKVEKVKQKGISDLQLLNAKRQFLKNQTLYRELLYRQNLIKNGNHEQRNNQPINKYNKENKNQTTTEKNVIYEEIHEETTESKIDYDHTETRRLYNKDEPVSEYIDHELYNSFNSLHKPSKNKPSPGKEDDTNLEKLKKVKQLSNDRYEKLDMQIKKLQNELYFIKKAADEKTNGKANDSSDEHHLNAYNKANVDEYYRRNLQVGKDMARNINETNTTNTVERVIPENQSRNNEKIREEEYSELIEGVTETTPRNYEEYYEDNSAVPGLKYHI